MKKHIEDFGQKIGGARKDFYTKALTVDDLNELDDIDLKKYLVKDNIWHRPDYKALKEKGVELERLMFVKMVYDAIPKQDLLRPETFIEMVQFLEKLITPALTDADFETKLKTSFYYKEFRDAGYYSTDRKLFSALRVTLGTLKHTIQKKKFLMTEAEYYLRYSFVGRLGNVISINGDHIEIRADGFGVIYRYPTNINEFEVGKYVIIDNRTIRGHFDLFDTEEEAEKARQKIAKSIQPSETSTRKRTKTAFTPYLRGEIKRTGENFLKGRNATGNDYLNTFKFRGGEFGNWLNNNERQDVLNHGYNAFCDLAKALNISNDSVSLGKELAIAFGARGVGRALAHYEPARKVINLTKMKGAGALAHEWGHALDYYLQEHPEMSDYREEVIKAMTKKEILYTPEKPDVDKIIEDNFKGSFSWVKYGVGYSNLSDEDKKVIEDKFREEMKRACKAEFSVSLMSELSARGRREHFLDNFKDWMKNKYDIHLSSDTINNITRWLYSINGKANISTEPYKRVVPTDYKTNSSKFDKEHSTCDKGYWGSDVEMWARAFALYVHEKLDRSDYLCGLVDVGEPIPQGEEKDLIFSKFDALITKCKENHLLEEPPVEKPKKKIRKTVDKTVYPVDEDGQYRLFDI